MSAHPTGENASTPEAIRAAFVAVATATDTTPPDTGPRLPAVNLAQSISSLARTVGMILHRSPLFRYGAEGFFTVDAEGRLDVMTAERFTSWVEDWLAFTKPTKDAPSVESIGKDTAAKLLAADQFKAHIRELKGVAEVRMPVWTGEGSKRTVELAPVGYCEGTGIFTTERITYQEDMPAEEAWDVIWDALREFPFDPEGEPSIKFRRSFSAQIAAMVGVFCHSLFSEGTPKPMIVHSANQSGAGKSQLMRLAIAPVHGPPPEAGKPENEAELEKVLDTAAIARKPFLVLDDCRSIHSQALNRFVTSPVHECRLMHSQRMFCGPKITQVFATGNNLTVTEDLNRRALIIDLFEPGEASTRQFAREITSTWLFDHRNRARILAALWAFVRRWCDDGMKPMREHRRGSFEEWSSIVGGIVIACGLTNPFAPRRVENGGDEASRALSLVIGNLVGESPLETPPILTTSDILDRAEAQGLLETIVGLGKMEPKKALGHRLKKLKARHLIDSQNRMFEFGRRELATGARYPIRFIGTAEPPRV